MLIALLSSVSLLLLGVYGQASTPYNDPFTGITFQGYVDPYGFTCGYVLPKDATTDFVGQIVVPLRYGEGWGSISLGDGMLRHVLIAAWSNKGKVMSTFRFAVNHNTPPAYSSSATMKPIEKGTYVNTTHVSYTFLCSKCLTGDSRSFNPNDTAPGVAWALSYSNPREPEKSTSPLTFHDGGLGVFALNTTGAKSDKYSTYASMAT